MARSARFAIIALLILGAPGFAQGGGGGGRDMQLRQAESLERAGELGRAFKILNDVLEEAPAESRALLALERVNRRMRRTGRTLEAIERAKQTAPGQAVPRQIELRVLAELGQTDRLRDAGEAWITLQPESEQAYQDYANALRGTGARDEAERVLKAGQAALGRPASLTSELADLYAEGKRWPEVAAEWVSLLSDSPRIGWELITYRFERLGNDAQPAAEALIVALEPRASAAIERRTLAVAGLYADRPDVTRLHAAALLPTMDEESRRAFVDELARVASRRSQHEVVSWAYRSLLPYVSDDARLGTLARQIVQFDLSAGDTAAAIEITAEVVERSRAGSGSHRWASGWLVRLSAARGDARAAERAFERHVELYPTDPEIPSLALSVSESNMRDGRLEEAERILSSVPLEAGDVRLAAQMTAARAYLGLYAGRYDDARAALESVASLLDGEERSDALRYLGFLRDANEAELEAAADAHRSQLQDQPVRAHDRLVNRLRRAPASAARPGLLLLAAELALEGGDLDRAEPVLRRVAAEYPHSGEAPVALLTLADALAGDASRIADAVETLETLILEYPESALAPLARRRLAEVKQQVPRS